MSSIDNIIFSLCSEGFFGKHLRERSDEVKRIALKDGTELDRSPRNASSPQHKKMRLPLPFHSLIVLLVFFCMVSGWGIILHRQVSGIFYTMKYPQCQVKQQGYNITNIGDGKCDGGLYNRYECGFDGGGKHTYEILVFGVLICASMIIYSEYAMSMIYLFILSNAMTNIILITFIFFIVFLSIHISWCYPIW